MTENGSINQSFSIPEIPYRDARDALMALAARDGFAETVARHWAEHYGVPGGDREIPVCPDAPHAPHAM